MAKFVLVPETDSIIEITNDKNEVVGSIEAIDAVQLYGDAIQSAQKFSKDLIDVYIDTIAERTNVVLTRSQAITFFNYANDMLEDLKKKSCQLQNQYDFTELDQPTLDSTT